MDLDNPKIRNGIYITIVLIFVLLINYVFLLWGKDRLEYVTRTDIYLIIAIDAIIGAALYWADKY